MQWNFLQLLMWPLSLNHKSSKYSCGFYALHFISTYVKTTLFKHCLNYCIGHDCGCFHLLCSVAIGMEEVGGGVPLYSNCEQSGSNYLKNSVLVEPEFHKAKSSWKGDGHSAGQKCSCLLQNPKIHQHVNKNPSLEPVLIQGNPVQTSLIFLWSILILSFHLYMCLPSGIFPLGFLAEIL